MHPSSSTHEVSLTRCELLARLKQAKEYLGWSLKSLSKRAGGSDTSWDYWLKGTRDISEYFVKRAVKVMTAALDDKRKTLGDDANALWEWQEIRDSLQVIPELWGRAQKEEQAAEPSGQTSPPVSLVLLSDRLTDAADQLAAQVAKQWVREADNRKLRLPGPIPVRWHWTGGVTSDVSVVANDPPRRSPVFPALPGVTPVTTASLQAGGLRELFCIYGGVDSGRVVILGKYGTGKSTSAILTLLEALLRSS